jgi:alkylhydroperoxidase family enzyme
MNKVEEAETLNIRRGEATDPRIRIITRLAAEIAANRGRVSTEALDAFWAEGFDKAALIDLISLVIDKSLANYVHNLTQIEIDWPAAQKVEASFELA